MRIVNYISDVVFKDSVFIAKISFEHLENKAPRALDCAEEWDAGGCGDYYEETSLLQRFMRSITKMLNSN